MNPLSRKLTTGTIGKLLVELRLLQFDVQAAPPLKDSGNDLIAVRGHAMRAIQIKTSAGHAFSGRRLPRFYHILAAVRLVGDGEILHLDKCEVFLIPKEELPTVSRQFARLLDYRLTRSLVDRLFKPRRLHR